MANGKKIGFGLIGAGAIGPFHAEAIHDIPDANFVGICDTDLGRAKALAEKFSVDYVCDDYHELLKRDDIDIVNVATPPFANEEITAACAKAGKHLIVEKPMSVTLKEADNMIEACNKAGVKLGVIFPMRYHETSKQIKTMVEEGKLGKMVLGHASTKWYRSKEYYDVAGWRKTWKGQGGGALPNQAIHAIDMLQWIMGPVDSLTAYYDTLTHDIEVEDNAVAIIRFKNRALGIIEASTSVYPGFPRRMEFSGELGTVVMKAGELELIAIQNEDIKISGGPEKDYIDKRLGDCSYGPTHQSPDPHRYQIEEFMQAIQEGREPFVNGEEGRKAMEIIAAIYQSSRTGKEIRFPFSG